MDKGLTLTDSQMKAVMTDRISNRIRVVLEDSAGTILTPISVSCDGNTGVQWKIKVKTGNSSEGAAAGVGATVQWSCDGSKWLTLMTGHIDDNGAVRNQGYVFDDTLTFTVVDMTSYKGTKRKPSTTAYAGYYICNPGNPDKSLVHILGRMMGVTAFDVGDLSAYAKDIVEVGENTVWQELQDIAECYDADLAFTADGKLYFHSPLESGWTGKTPDWTLVASREQEGKVARASSVIGSISRTAPSATCNRAKSTFSTYERGTAGVIYRDTTNWNEATKTCHITIPGKTRYPESGYLSLKYKDPDSGEEYPYAVNVETPKIGGRGYPIYAVGGRLKLISFDGSTTDTQKVSGESQIVLYNDSSDTCTIEGLQIYGIPYRKTAESTVEEVDSNVTDEIDYVMKEVDGKYATDAKQLSDVLSRLVARGKTIHRTISLETSFLPQVQVGEVMRLVTDDEDDIWEVKGYKHTMKGAQMSTLRTSLDLVEVTDYTPAAAPRTVVRHPQTARQTTAQTQIEYAAWPDPDLPPVPNGTYVIDGVVTAVSDSTLTQESSDSYWSNGGTPATQAGDFVWMRTRTGGGTWVYQMVTPRRVISSITYTYAVTTTQDMPDDATSTAIPAMSEDNKYLWRKQVITYNDGTFDSSISLAAVYGDKGNPGEKGATGKPGATGTSVTGIVEEYALSTSSTSVTGTWGTAVPTLSPTDKYLWNRSKTMYSDGTSSAYTTAVVIGVYGDTGKAMTYMYASAPEGLSPGGCPFGTDQNVIGMADTAIGINDEWHDTVPDIADGYVLWTKTTAPDGTVSIYRVQGPKGEPGNPGATGATGRGISSIAHYYATTSTQSAPSASSITSTTIPAMSASKKYLWRKTVITYTDSTTSHSVELIAVYGDTGDSASIKDFDLDLSAKAFSVSPRGYTRTAQTIVATCTLIHVAVNAVTITWSSMSSQVTLTPSSDKTTCTISVAARVALLPFRISCAVTGVGLTKTVSVDVQPETGNAYMPIYLGTNWDTSKSWSNSNDPIWSGDYYLDTSTNTPMIASVSGSGTITYSAMQTGNPNTALIMGTVLSDILAQGSGVQSTCVAVNAYFGAIAAKTGFIKSLRSQVIQSTNYTYEGMDEGKPETDASWPVSGWELDGPNNVIKSVGLRSAGGEFHDVNITSGNITITDSDMNTILATVKDDAPSKLSGSVTADYYLVDEVVASSGMAENAETSIACRYDGASYPIAVRATKEINYSFYYSNAYIDTTKEYESVTVVLNDTKKDVVIYAGHIKNSERRIELVQLFLTSPSGTITTLYHDIDGASESKTFSVGTLPMGTSIEAIFGCYVVGKGGYRQGPLLEGMFTVTASGNTYSAGNLYLLDSSFNIAVTLPLSSYLSHTSHPLVVGSASSSAKYSMVSDFIATLSVGNFQIDQSKTMTYSDGIYGSITQLATVTVTNNSITMTRSGASPISYYSGGVIVGSPSLSVYAVTRLKGATVYNLNRADENSLVGTAPKPFANVWTQNLNNVAVTDNNNQSLAGAGASSIVGAINQINRDFFVFFVDGLLAENDGNTIHAYGRATVFLVHGLALVSFAINVQDVSSSSTTDFSFGIRPAKLSGLNSAIPVITPIAGGTCIYSYKGSGKTNLAGELNGNGGTMLTLNGNWQFARVYQNYSSTLVGGWPTSVFSTSINMSGICFGRY